MAIGEAARAEHEGRELLPPQDFALEVALADLSAAILGNEHTIGPNDLGVGGVVQVVDFPARLAIHADLKDAAGDGQAAWPAAELPDHPARVELNDQRQPQHAPRQVELGQVELRAVFAPPTRPRTAVAVPFLLGGPGPDRRRLFATNGWQQLLDAPALVGRHLRELSNQRPDGLAVLGLDQGQRHPQPHSGLRVLEQCLRSLSLPPHSTKSERLARREDSRSLPPTASRSRRRAGGPITTSSLQAFWRARKLLLPRARTRASMFWRTFSPGVRLRKKSTSAGPSVARPALRTASSSA